MLYLWIKLLHILSATILFGTGIGTAAVLVYGYYSKNKLITAASFLLIFYLMTFKPM